MSKLKIEHGVSKTERVKLQVSVDQSVSTDIELLAKWSNNEKNYLVNELLRFALEQTTDFQQHKATLGQGKSVAPVVASVAAPVSSSKPMSVPTSSTSKGITTPAQGRM